MASVLLLSADPALLDQVQEMLAPHNIRLRNVSIPTAAKDWLSMQAFDVLLIDSRYGETIPIEILAFAWKHHPMLLGSLIDLNGDFAEKWTAQAMGAHIFAGPSALVELRKFVQSLPESFSVHEKQKGRYAVLVVEDIDSPRDIIRAYIETLGYSRVDGASSAAEALDILHNDPSAYFCVVTDILMPRTNGIELTRLIRSDTNQTIAYLPVIILTAVPTTEHLLAALRAGATGFLVKPPKKMTLKKELEKARRIIMTKRSPRLCQEKDAHLLEASLRKLGVG